MAPTAEQTRQNEINRMVSVTAMKIGQLSHTRSGPGARTATNIEVHVLNNILEATASLAVSNPKLQVVAVALDIGDGEGPPRLTIAENGDLEPGLAEYMEYLWNLLSKQQPQEVKKEIIQLAYCYSVSRNLKRYDNWMDRLKLVSTGLTAMPGGIAGFQRLVEALKWTHNFLKMIQTAKVLHPSPVNLVKATDEKDWGGLIDCMDFILLRVTELKDRFGPWTEWLESPDRISTVEQAAGNLAQHQEWVDSLRAPSGRLLITRALESLTSQHRHINTLLKASGDPNLELLFSSKIVIRAVPATPNVLITLPIGMPGWNELIGPMYRSIKPKIGEHVISTEVNALDVQAKRRLLDEQAAADKKWREDEDRRKVEGHTEQPTPKPTPKPYGGVVHCECALVAYLEDPINKAKGQFHYIGVSKLSCGACHSWLTAYNTTRDDKDKYYTAGTRGKWYHPWAMPPSIVSKELNDDFENTVSSEFVRYCDPPGQYRTLKCEDYTGSAHLFTLPVVKKVVVGKTGS